MLSGLLNDTVMGVLTVAPVSPVYLMAIAAAVLTGVVDAEGVMTTSNEHVALYAIVMLFTHVLLAMVTRGSAAVSEGAPI